MLGALEQSNIPILIQVHDWARLPESFHREIEQDYVVVRKRIKQDMTDQWQTALWGELATLEYGKSLRDYDNPTGLYRVYGTNGPIGWHSEPLCPYASVIIGRKGAYRGVHYSPAPFFVIDTAFYLKSKTELDTRWAYYQLLTMDINGMDSGSAIPSTSREDFYGLSVKVPPLREQRAIAHVLGVLDDKIELNRRVNETLEDIARTLFKSWFIDFDPVRAKMEGCYTGLPPHIADLFPDRMVDSELGKIPEGWEIKELNDLAQISSGKRPNLRLPTKAKGVKVPVWGGNGPMAFTSEALINQPVLITGRVGTLGSVFRVTSPCWPSDNTIIITPLLGQLLEFLYFHIQRIDLRALNRGSTQPLLTQSDVKSILLAFPPIKVLDHFGEIQANLFARVDTNEMENKRLNTLKNTLLPKLITGEVQLPHTVLSSQDAI